MTPPSPSPGRRRYVERARIAMREAILQAVEDLVLDRGWEETRMADVAARAGVSRQTVYQLYGSREALAQAYVLREADRFLDAVDDAIRGHADDPLAALAAGLEVFLSDASDNVLVKAITGGDANGGLLPLITTHGLPVLELARARLAAAIDELWPVFADDDVRLFADSVVRLAISHLTTSTSSPDAATRDITRLLTPFIRDALSPRAP